ncbi:atherin-like [Calypte anna]|uniref:atherin-like n=1 Tax=Calypte anna TaxID=9244 RepID=UPI0011C34F25|nr:atherin-like [Calypte anna]
MQVLSIQIHSTKFLNKNKTLPRANATPEPARPHRSPPQSRPGPQRSLLLQRQASGRGERPEAGPGRDTASPLPDGAEQRPTAPPDTAGPFAPLLTSSSPAPHLSAPLACGTSPAHSPAALGTAAQPAPRALIVAIAAAAATETPPAAPESPPTHPSQPITAPRRSRFVALLAKSAASAVYYSPPVNRDRVSGSAARLRVRNSLQIRRRSAGPGGLKPASCGTRGKERGQGFTAAPSETPNGAAGLLAKTAAAIPAVLCQGGLLPAHGTEPLGELGAVLPSAPHESRDCLSVSHSVGLQCPVLKYFYSEVM